MKYENLEQVTFLHKEIKFAQHMITELTSEKPMTFSRPGGDGFKGFQVTQFLPSIDIALMKHYEQVITVCVAKLEGLGVKFPERYVQEVKNDA